jgi:hypothetical protein
VLRKNRIKYITAEQGLFCEKLQFYKNINVPQNVPSSYICLLDVCVYGGGERWLLVLKLFLLFQIINY